jgi:hypothetical protein
MFGIIVLYISLFVANDTVKPVVNHTVPTTVNITTYSQKTSSDTINYSKTDSVISSDLPMTDKLEVAFPQPSIYQMMPLRHNKSQIFVTLLLFWSLLTVALVRATYPKEFEELFSVLRSMPLTQQIYRVQTNSLSMPLALLTINAVLSFSLSAYFLVQLRGTHLTYSGTSLFLIISAIVSLIFIYRISSALFTGMLFPVRKEMSFYTFCTLQILRISGIALLPLNILFAFGNPAWHNGVILIGIVAVLILTGFVYVRGFEITKDLFRDNKFHFLLYICTLEIAPALTIIKFLMNLVKK